MDSSLEYYEVSFWVSFYGLWFEVYFVWCKYCSPAFLPLHLLGILVIQPFAFSLCRSLFLRWVSFRQHICGPCFFIHSTTLCLLIGALNPFTFKVIIDRYLFNDTFPLCTYVPFSLTLFLPLLKAIPLACLTLLVWFNLLFLLETPYFTFHFIFIFIFFDWEVFIIC